MMNWIHDISFRYFNYLFALVIAAMYANALIFPNMGVDASFYLRVTEHIMDGAIPEHDLRILYPPLIFYMLLPLKFIVGKVVAYELFLSYMFLIQAINAFLIYKISGKYTEYKFIRVFAALLYLFLSIKLEGEYFFLEPFINFWGLLAIWTYLLKKNAVPIWLLLPGFLAFLAFLTKQYGLAYAGLVGMLILIDWRHSVKDLFMKGLFFSSGLIGALLIFVLLFRLGYGTWYDFLAGGRLGVYGEKDISGLFSGILFYIVIAPFIFTLFIPDLARSVLKLENHFLAYLFLLFLLTIQLFFQQYDHYYILMLPALMLMGVIIGGFGLKKNRRLFFLIIILSLFVNELFVGQGTKGLILSRHSTLKEDMLLAKSINEIIPAESEVYIFSNVKLYYLCHFRPVIPEKYGYAWNHMTSLSELIKILKQSSWVIVESKDLQNSYPLTDTTILILPSIQHNFNFIKDVGGFMLFKKPII